MWYVSLKVYIILHIYIYICISVFDGYVHVCMAEIDLKFYDMGIPHDQATLRTP